MFNIKMLSHFTELKASKEREARFSRFLNRYHKEEISLNSNWTEKECEDIREAVTEAVEDIAMKIFNAGRSEVRKYIELAGSCQEGTKIKAPDEFDFLIKIPFFSEEDVEVDISGTINPWQFKCKHAVNFEPDDRKLNFKLKSRGQASVTCDHLFI